MKELLFVLFICIPCLIHAQATYDYDCEAKYRNRIAAAVDKCTRARLLLEMGECMTSPSSPTDAASKKKIAEANSMYRIQIAKDCNGTTGTASTTGTAGTGTYVNGGTVGATGNQAAIMRFQIGDMIDNQSAQIAAKINQNLDILSNELDDMKKDNMKGLSKDEYEFLNDLDVRSDLKNDIFNDANLSEGLPNSAFYKSKLEDLNKSSFAATNALAVKPNNSLVGEYDLSGTKSLFEDAVNTPIVTQSLKAFLLNLLPSRIGIPSAFGSHLFTNLNSVNNMGNGVIDELMDTLSGKTPPEQSWTNVKEVIENNVPFVGSLFRFAKRFL